VGLEKTRNYIVVDSPVNIHGNDCVCGNKKYALELKIEGNTKHLKISKSTAEMPTMRRISLGISDFIQNLLGIFTKNKS
jgi:hypothetical protein